jgi:hypothetical protein
VSTFSILFSFPCSSVGMPTQSLSRQFYELLHILLVLPQCSVHVFDNEYSVSGIQLFKNMPLEQLGRHSHARARERENEKLF